MSKQIGYIRVSTKEQSTARQLDGIKLDLTFEDKISGVIKDRPELSICLRILCAGDTLHVHSIDRLARSLRNLLEILEDLLARDITIIFHAENLTFKSGSDNPYATMQLQLLAVFAQFERTINKSRQREGNAMAKLNGTKSGKPWGNQPLDIRLRDEAIALCKQGMNISEISRSMKLSRPSIYKLLQ